MKIYKYVRLRDDWVTESSGRRESIGRKRRKKEEGLESGGRRKRFD